MNLATRLAIADVCDRILDTIEKCGGPGGTPGPCPGGRSGKPSGQGKRKPKKPSGSQKPKPGQQKPGKDGKGGTSKDVRNLAGKIRKGQYDLDTVSGTLGYFANAAVKKVDKALAKAEKGVKALEAGKAKLKEKLTTKVNAIKAKRDSLVGGIAKRFKRVAKIFKRLKGLVKAAKDQYQNDLAAEIEHIADHGDELDKLARECEDIGRHRYED